MSTYTNEQLTLYLARIGLPPDIEAARDQVRNDPLGYLTALQHHHMAHVPFESVSLHYSSHRLLSLDPEDLFHKIVTSKRGGYCMEVNSFFATVMRSLEYTLFCAGGRVYPGEDGWNHMLIMTTINENRYAVDVGFGSNGPTHPIPLQHNYEAPAIAPVRLRLEYRRLAIHTDPAQRLWVLSRREREDAAAPWIESYSFSDIEFFAADFAVMNLATMTAPQSFFVQNVTCVRLILDYDTKLPVGQVILHRDYVKRRVQGCEAEIVERLESEEHRVAALEKWFGIVLDLRERRAIRGLASELRPNPSHV